MQLCVFGKFMLQSPRSMSHHPCRCIFAGGYPHGAWLCSFEDLQLKPKTFNWACSKLSGAQIAASVSRSGNSRNKPASCATTVQNGVCNWGMPNASTRKRLVWVVQQFARMGFWVLLDNHTEDLTPYKGSKPFAAKWAALVAAICKVNPVAKTHLKKQRRAVMWLLQPVYTQL